MSQVMIGVRRVGFSSLIGIMLEAAECLGATDRDAIGVTALTALCVTNASALRQTTYRVHPPTWRKYSVPLLPVDTR